MLIYSGLVYNSIVDIIDVKKCIDLFRQIDFKPEYNIITIVSFIILYTFIHYRLTHKNKISDNYYVLENKINKILDDNIIMSINIKKNEEKIRKIEFEEDEELNLLNKKITLLEQEIEKIKNKKNDKMEYTHVFDTNMEEKDDGDTINWLQQGIDEKMTDETRENPILEYKPYFKEGSSISKSYYFEVDDIHKDYIKNILKNNKIIVLSMKMNKIGVGNRNLEKSINILKNYFTISN